MSSNSTKRRDWLFERQGGRCYLRTTDGCKARDGAMVIRDAKPKKGEPVPPDTATREHVEPRSKKDRAAPALILVACRECNSAKGCKDPAPEHVELAQRYAAEWEAKGLEKIERKREEKRRRRAEERERINRAHEAASANLKKQRKKRKRLARLGGRVGGLADDSPAPWFRPGPQR